MSKSCWATLNNGGEKMKRNRKAIKAVYMLCMARILPCLLLLLCLPLSGQDLPRVVSEADTTNIKIGEQLHFKVTVEADTSATVIFPEGQTFSPLETVEAYKTDTTRRNDRMTLQKTYALTQFDSGAYLLPTQRVEINGKGYFTDSLQINVATVTVDTLTQKMYDIKPLMEVERTYADTWKLVLFILAGLLLAGGLAYWFFFRKKPLTDEEKVALLPPYDRALMELKRLENSRYLIQDEFKQYYTELTDIVRSYLEEDVHVTALESTTGQLIDKLQLMKDAGQLRLDDHTILQFQKILETADLVKFAKSKPASTAAEQDRRAVEQLVMRTHEALPEPTEEELEQQEETLEIQRQRKQKRKYVLAAAAVLGLLLLGGSMAVVYYGFDYVRDSILGHPSKTLLEGEWVNSSYGYPPINLETPEVLLRENSNLMAAARAGFKEITEFEYASPENWFMIAASSLTLNQQEDPDYDAAVENVLKEFEKKGARNIITKQENFTTLSGVSGIKVYGSGTFLAEGSETPVKGRYAIYLFGGKGFQQRVVVSWEEEDPYAAEMAERITKSIEVKTQV
jgi:hypothetical protein